MPTCSAGCAPICARSRFLRAKVVDGKQEAGAKFSDYFDHSERWATVAGHRALAMLRGWNEEFLSVDIVVDHDDTSPVKPVERTIAAVYSVGGTLPGDKWLMEMIGWTWRVKLSMSLSLDLMRELRERAEEEAIHVFARNLKDLLLAAPAGSRATMGLDPGIRTGVKVAVVDGTGKLLETTTVYPFPPKNDIRGTQAELASLVRKHKIELIAIGNGTGSRETERLVADMLTQLPAGPKPTKVIVSEAGASVYSASQAAADEFPGLDVSLRGAVSIARRLQDPLAELVKIEPKSIGVGQYQHDVDQGRLNRSLDAVVEDAVNAVGVDLNTASAPLLARVSGLGKSSAEAIVAHRDATGAFYQPQGTDEGAAARRPHLRAMRRLPAHPRRQGAARRLLGASGSLWRGQEDRRRLRPRSARHHGRQRRAEAARPAAPSSTSASACRRSRTFFAELEKPGRDPRPSFKTATFADGVDDIKDLKPGMLLEGTVTNVAAFGAFVDIGVHQDGLVHVSQLADRFVKDPHEVVKAGDVVQVRVTEVDVPRKRIGLTMRKDGAVESGGREMKGDPKAAHQARQTLARAPAAKAAGAVARRLRRGAGRGDETKVAE